ncbi:hypothetical protein HNV12_04970 [Methanococcoides sp. SA1]|nr:hypothetical protein [Methanococcoides sp. SA1]
MAGTQPPNKVLGSKYFSPSIKIGINANRFSNDSKSYDEYSYPLGYLVGLSNETKISNQVYISNSLYYKYKQSISHVHIVAGGGGNVFDYKYTSNYIRFSPIIGFRIFDNTAILIGYDIGKMLTVDIDMEDVRNNYENFQKNHPDFDSALCFGVAKDLKIRNNNYKIELRYLYGLTEYKYHCDLGTLPHPVRHHGFHIELGYPILNK